MKMQLWEILNLPAIDNQTIGAFGELKFIDKVLDGGIQIHEESCVG